MEEQLKQLDEKINNTQNDTNIEEIEPAEYMFEKAKIYIENNKKNDALNELKLVITRTRSFNLKMDAVFEVLHVGIKNKDLILLREYLDLCHKLLKDGGDWEKRNKLKVYEGLYSILTKDFKEAGKLFLDALMTFTNYELFSYKDFVFYTSLCNIITVDRKTLKTRIIENSDVVACIKEIPHLEAFMDQFYNGNYIEFFQTFAKIIERIKDDFFMSKYYKHFIREMRIKTYSQYLRIYYLFRII